MKVHNRPANGFSLLEIAIVLMIVGALMGAMLQPYGAHIVERQRKDTQSQLRQIQSAVLGFGAAHHRLPCPLVNSAQPFGDCSVSHGYVPAALLGLDGRVDDNGLLVDAWDNPIRYSVTGVDSDNDGQSDFTAAFGMHAVGMQYLKPGMQVCSSAAGCKTLRANQVPVVLYSVGPTAAPRSDDEQENLDEDNRFVMREPDRAGSDQFDDLVLWVSENTLYTYLIRAGVLP